MENISKTVLTNMVMLYQKDGSFLVQKRLKQDWPGLNFPGGHVQREESIEESAKREILEETSLLVNSLHFVGYYEWNLPKDNIRHLAILFRSNDFSGTLHDSSEGPLFWIHENELNKYSLSQDFMPLLSLMKKGLHW